jgi:hypothetical protein
MKSRRTGWEYFLRQRDESLDYKWLESEKLGSDIGIERAIRDWLQKQHPLGRRPIRLIPRSTPPSLPLNSGNQVSSLQGID